MAGAALRLRPRRLPHRLGALALSDGLASDARTGDLIGVSVETEDPRIAAAIVARLGGSRPHFTVGDRTTFVIANTLKAE